MMNVVALRGRLSRPAEDRELPSGDRVVNLEVTVREDGFPTETVPVVWYEPPASAYALDVDSEVVVVGRVRRRFFRAGGSTQSRTEVVAQHVIAARRTKQVQRVVLDALRTAEEVAVG